MYLIFLRNIFISSNLFLHRGFTLIELLVVIAIVSVMAAVVVVGVDPVDKINAANDSEVQSEINGIASSAERWITTNTSASGSYPAAAALSTSLVASGEIKSYPVPPTGYGASYTVTGGGGAPLTISASLKAKKYTSASQNFWVWCSSKGDAKGVATATTCP